MADQYDPKEIASRYLDLWLDHWERTARDPEAVDAMARMVQEAVTQQADFQRHAAKGLFGVNPGAAFASLGPWFELMQQYADGATQENEANRDAAPPKPTGKPAAGGSDTGTNGATAAGAASGADPERVAELLHRLAELESRIDDLERSGPTKPARPKRTKPSN